MTKTKALLEVGQGETAAAVHHAHLSQLPEYRELPIGGSVMTDKEAVRMIGLGHDEVAALETGPRDGDGRLKHKKAVGHILLLLAGLGMAALGAALGGRYEALRCDSATCLVLDTWTGRAAHRPIR